MSGEALFCDVNDFCRRFLRAWHRQLLTREAAIPNLGGIARSLVDAARATAVPGL